MNESDTHNGLILKHLVKMMSFSAHDDPMGEGDIDLDKENFKIHFAIADKMLEGIDTYLHPDTVQSYRDAYHRIGNTLRLLCNELEEPEPSPHRCVAIGLNFYVENLGFILMNKVIIDRFCDLTKFVIDEECEKNHI